MSSDLPAWGNILNPRLKGIVLHEAGEDMHKRAVDNLESFIKNLPTTVEEERTDEDLTLEESTKESPIEELKRRRGVEVDEEGNKSDFKKEMILYKKLKEPKSDQEVLSFWKENEPVLPLLASAARYVLAANTAVSLVAVAPVRLDLPRPLGGLGDGEGDLLEVEEGAHASGDPL